MSAGIPRVPPISIVSVRVTPHDGSPEVIMTRKDTPSKLPSVPELIAKISKTYADTKEKK